uniref:Putative secreted protein n=1 Tax=Anopheles darlingi TaxID=43151 RepID=A0A2M4DJC3_ANODA
MIQFRTVLFAIFIHLFSISMRSSAVRYLYRMNIRSTMYSDCSFESCSQRAKGSNRVLMFSLPLARNTNISRRWNARTNCSNGTT